MALDVPDISIKKDFARPQKNGQVELQLTCQVKTPASDFSGLQVTLIHHDGHRETVLHRGPLDIEGRMVVNTVLEESSATRGHIFAILKGTTIRGAAQEPLRKSPKTAREDWSSLDAFVVPDTSQKEATPPPTSLYLGRQRKRPIAPVPSMPPGLRQARRRQEEYAFVVPDTSQKETAPPPTSPYLGRQRKRPIVQIPSMPPGLRQARRRQEETEIPKPQVPTLPWYFSVKKKIWRTARYLIGIAAIGATGAGVVKHEYTQGVEDAKEVAHDTRILGTLPLQIQREDMSFQALTYISSGPFIEEDIKRWNANSEAYGKNHPDNPQSHHINWNIKTVSSADVQPGGPLYLTRQALTYGEDRWAETGTGINPKRLLRPLLGDSNAATSTLADQICGSIWEQTGKFQSLSQLKKISGHNRFSPARLRRKERELFCAAGLGLGKQMTVDEMFAAYMSYIHFGNGAEGVRNFMIRYWGINDLNDPAFTRGHKIVLAALPAHPVPYTDPKKDREARKKKIEEEWTKPKGIRQRALGILNGLVENGTIPASEKATIAKEIEEARPNFDIYEKTRKSKNTDYEFAKILAREELATHLRSSRKTFFDWRNTAEGLLIALEPNLQTKLPSLIKKGVQALPAGAVGTVLVINEKGEYVGVFTGAADGYQTQSNSRRLTEIDNPGSTGKLFIGAQIAALGYLPDDPDPRVKRAAHDLSVSSRHFLPAAIALGIDSSKVKEAIECYGEWRTEISVNPIEAAVSGNWTIRPIQFPGALYAMMTGEILPDPHLIVGETSGQMTHAWETPSTFGDAHCAELMYANGRAKAWGALPLKGTMKKMHIPPNVAFYVGKTGTAERVGKDGNAVHDHSTNIVWAPFAVQMENGQHYIIITTIRPEKRTLTTNPNSGKKIEVVRKDFTTDMGYKLWASDIAVPVSNQVLQIVSKIQ